jgi:flagellar motor switch protein FliG
MYARKINENEKYELKRPNLNFDIINEVDHVALQKIISKMDKTSLKTALLDTTDEIKYKIFSNMPGGLSEDLQYDMQYMADTLETIQEAQKEIIDTIIYFISTGKIVKKHRNGKEIYMYKYPKDKRNLLQKIIFFLRRKLHIRVKGVYMD